MFLLCALLARAGELPADATGRFVATQSPAEVAGLLADAVTRSAESVPWAFRGFARSSLEEQVMSCPAYTVELTATTFSVQCDGRKQHTWTLGITAPFTTDKGETVQMSVRQAGRSVHLSFAGERGGKTFTYTFPEAGGLVVHQEVTSKYLEVPMAWTLTFDKV